ARRASIRAVEWGALAAISCRLPLKMRRSAGPISLQQEEVAAVSLMHGAGAVETFARLKILEDGAIGQRVGNEALAGRVEPAEDDGVFGPAFAVHDRVGLDPRGAGRRFRSGRLRQAIQLG